MYVVLRIISKIRIIPKMLGAYTNFELVTFSLNAVIMVECINVKLIYFIISNLIKLWKKMFLDYFVYSMLCHELRMFTNQP